MAWWTAALKHFQHTVGNQKSAHHVAGGGDHGYHTEYGREGALVFADQHDGSEHRNGIKRVRERHQWRVQQRRNPRSEEHTSELQSLAYLVCRLLLEKKKKRYASSNSCTYFQCKPHSLML